MKRFIISSDPYTIGFDEHVQIDLLHSLSDRNNKKKIPLTSVGVIAPEDIRRLIDNHSSMRVDFGWAFESDRFYEQVMQDCLNNVIKRYNFSPGLLVSDMRCSWLGFVPYNTFERKSYEGLSAYSLVLFHNELIDYQNEVIDFISNHKIFLQHSILRNESYRFYKFKKIRKNRDELMDTYRFYLDACREVSLIAAMPRDILEEQIGCHFLYHPDLFFELLEISILKGEIYE